MNSAMGRAFSALICCTLLSAWHSNVAIADTSEQNRSVWVVRVDGQSWLDAVEQLSNSEAVNSEAAQRILDTWKLKKGLTPAFARAVLQSGRASPTIDLSKPEDFPTKGTPGNDKSF